VGGFLVGAGGSKGLGTPRDLIVHDRGSLAEVKRRAGLVLSDWMATDGVSRVMYASPKGTANHVDVLDVKTDSTLRLDAKGPTSVYAAAPGGAFAVSVASKLVLFDRRGKITAKG
jgi:hypothetical protein